VRCTIRSRRGYASKTGGSPPLISTVARARADAGDRIAAWRLAELLAGRGNLDEAVQILREAPSYQK
jgi:hypothetical protein